ncbi:SPASM domain-containing protein [bacterium]|nr:SPASM domain-containing protein [bacterium]
MLNYSKLKQFACLLISKFVFFKKKSILPYRWHFELKGKNIENELTTEDWYNITTQIPLYSTVVITGNDPLEREDFSEILRDVSKKTFKRIELECFAHNLTPKITNTLIDVQLKKIAISIDNDKIKESFEKLNEFCKILKLNNYNITVELRADILGNNFSDLINIFEFASNKGFDFLSLYFKDISPVRNTTPKDTFGKEFYCTMYPIEQYFDFEEFENFNFELFKIKKYSKTEIIFKPELKNPIYQTQLERIYSKDCKLLEIYNPCIYPCTNLYINPVGDIYPCLSYKMGNVKENSIKEILSNQKYKAFLENLKNKKLFMSCSMCHELTLKD